MPQQYPKRLPARLEHHIHALELRKAGKTYLQIGQELGISLSCARRLVKKACEALRGKREEEAWEVLTLELQRLDAQVEALWPGRADPQVANALIRIADHRAKLLALFAPAKHEVTGANGGPIATQGDIGGVAAVKQALADMLGRSQTEPDDAPDAGAEG
jgi:hypothetical protein